MKEINTASPIENQKDRDNFLPNFKNEIKSLESKEIELLLKKLNYLSLNFDPFQEEKDNTCLNIIYEFGLNNFIENPFNFTNALLQLLDVAQTKLKEEKTKGIH